MPITGHQSTPTLEEFVGAVYPHDGDSLIELRALPSKAREFIRRNDAQSLRRFAKRAGNIYFGVATRASDRDGTAENLAELTALFVDIDIAGDDPLTRLANIQVVSQRLRRFPLEPSITVASGSGGSHAYWLFASPLSVRTEKERARAKSYLRRLAVAVGGDLASAEPARVLRLPGTKNHKHTPPADVTIEQFDATRRYTLDELERVLPPEPSESSTTAPRDTEAEAGSPIRKGKRNPHLTSLAGSMRRRGMTEGAIAAALLAENTSRCDPPLEAAEVAAIAASVAKYPPADDATKKKATKAEKPKQGRDVLFEELEPWPEPVDGAVLLDGMADTFRRYLALPAQAPEALALWVLHAYTFPASFTTPFLAITSPAKRCGKTLTLIVVGALVPRRMFAANVTPAVLFRAIEKFKPTLLIDEADTFVRDNEELRGVLNSGHTRTTATVIRAVGDDHDPRAFSTWCPKAIALIGKLPGTLDDRSIEIRMRRRTPGEQVRRLRQDRIDAECLTLRRMAARWADDHLDALKDADPEVPTALHDRAADCWRPLLAIADAADGAWPALARSAALALSGATEGEDDIATMLLLDIKTIFEDEDADVLASTTILEKLTTLDDRPWKEYGKHGKPMNGAKLAWMLKGYEVLPAGTVRIGPKTAKGYRRAAFADAWRRYLPDAHDAADRVDRDAPRGAETSHRHNANEFGGLLPFTKGNTPIACDASQSVTNPISIEQCDGVTDRHPREGDPEQLPVDPEVARGRF